MGNDTVPIGTVHDARKQRRTKLSKNIRSLATLMREEAKSIQDGLRYEVEGFAIEVSFCNGTMLMCTWTFDGEGDFVLPWHRPDGAHEHMSMVAGGEVHFEFDGGFKKTLTNPGDVVYALPDTPYRVTFRANGDAAQGWLILQPPDTNIVPKDENGNCLLQPYGRCGGDPDNCLYTHLRSLLEVRTR